MGQQAYEYLTVLQLCRKLGWKADRNARRRLIRKIRSREAALGKKILFPSLGGKNGAMTTTIPHLRKTCPELFSRRDEVAERIRERFEKIEDRLSAIESQLAAVSG